MKAFLWICIKFQSCARVMKDIHTELSEQKLHCSSDIKYAWISNKVDINQIQTMFIVQSVPADADLGKSSILVFTQTPNLV